MCCILWGVLSYINEVTPGKARYVISGVQLLLFFHSQQLAHPCALDHVSMRICMTAIYLPFPGKERAVSYLVYMLLPGVSVSQRFATCVLMQTDKVCNFHFMSPTPERPSALECLRVQGAEPSAAKY